MLEFGFAGGYVVCVSMWLEVVKGFQFFRYFFFICYQEDGYSWGFVFMIMINGFMFVDFRKFSIQCFSLSLGRCLLVRRTVFRDEGRDGGIYGCRFRCGYFILFLRLYCQEGVVVLYLVYFKELSFWFILGVRGDYRREQGGFRFFFGRDQRLCIGS